MHTIFFFFLVAALDLPCSSLALELKDLVVKPPRLSCPAACEILVPRRGNKPTSPTLEGGFSATGPAWKSLDACYTNRTDRVLFSLFRGERTLSQPDKQLIMT